jgi:uncharacterized membrane protein YqjE
MENIKDIIFKFFRLNNFVDHLSGFVETRIALLKIEIQEEVTEIISKGLVLFLIFFFLFLFLMFLSLGLAIYLNRWFDDSYTGFLLVGGLYFVVFGLFVLLRKNINQVIGRRLMEVMRKKDL